MRAGVCLFPWLVSALAAQHTTDAAQLVAQLAGDGRDSAHTQLVALGPLALPALLDGIGKGRNDWTIERLHVLQEIGPQAGSAVPALLEFVEGTPTPPVLLAWLEATGDLVPYRPAMVDVDVAALMRHLAAASVVLPFDEFHQLLMGELQERLRVRSQFRASDPIAWLMAAAQGYRAYRVEVAIELLGQRGSAAREALPALREVMERADPRILSTDRSVPLRAKSSRAVLAIAPEDADAQRARAVLEGAPPRPVATPALPDRLRIRVRELMSDLGEPAQREAAIAVLTQLGPRAADAVPALLDALLHRPATESLSIVAALTATAPWCRDQLPPLTVSMDAGSVAVMGHAIEGVPGVEFVNALRIALEELGCAAKIDPNLPPAALCELLRDTNVTMREHAVRTVRRLGANARALLPVVAKMLTANQPMRLDFAFAHGRGGRAWPVDRNAKVHRLAAEAILAIAAPDDPQVARARDLLQSTEKR